MSLLTIVRDVCDRLSLPRPTAVFNSTDPLVLGLLGHAQQEGKELGRRASWQALTSEHTFTTVAQAAQPDGLAPDFDWYVDETMFDRTLRRRVYGPLSHEEWQQIQASLVTLVNPAFRIRGDALLISPTPGVGNVIAYEYVTRNWCRSDMAVPQSEWAADSDVTPLDEELIKLGIIWRFKQAKGFDYGEPFRTYEIQVAKKINRDGARPRISTSPGYIERVPNAPQVPETLVF